MKIYLVGRDYPLYTSGAKIRLLTSSEAVSTSYETRSTFITKCGCVVHNTAKYDSQNRSSLCTFRLGICEVPNDKLK